MTAKSSRRFGAVVLGTIALGLFAGAVALTGFFLKGGLEGGTPVHAVFAAPGVGQQLPIGGDVKVRGVLVGRIAAIDLDEDGNAVIELRLDSRSPLPSDSRAEIRSKTVFGQKWVELIPPPRSDAPPFAENDVIPDSRTQEPLELERALQLGHDLLSAIPMRDLADALDALADGFEGTAPDAHTAMDRGLEALRGVNAKGGDLDLALRQLREFSRFLDKNSGDVLSFMESLDDANRALVGAAPEFRKSLRSVPRFLDAFTRFQKVTEKDLGRLVEEGATLAEIVSARRSDLVDLVLELEPFTTVWNSGLEQPCGGAFEQDMVCWQVYQPPGLESRGLYDETDLPPVADEPSDPLFGRWPQNAPLNALRNEISRDGKAETSRDLAQILLDPLREKLTSLRPTR